MIRYFAKKSKNQGKRNRPTQPDNRQKDGRKKPARLETSRLEVIIQAGGDAVVEADLENIAGVVGQSSHMSDQGQPRVQRYAQSGINTYFPNSINILGLTERESTVSKNGDLSDIQESITGIGGKADGVASSKSRQCQFCTNGKLVVKNITDFRTNRKNTSLRISIAGKANTSSGIELGVCRSGHHNGEQYNK